MSVVGQKTIPLMRPRLPSAERLLGYLRHIDKNRVYANYGPLALEFEMRVAHHLGLIRHAVTSANSGTSALVGATLASAGRACDQRPLAMLPSFTFVATASAVEQCGYRPYLVDIDRDSWALDPVRLLEHSILDRVGVVIVVAPFGRPVAQEPWIEFRQRTGIPVVIDGAASFTVAHQVFGPLPVAVSFHATKGFGIGEGGAIVSTDTDLVKQVRRALNFGFEMGRREAVAPHINGKLSEYQAAVGLAQFDDWAGTRREFEAVAEVYRGVMAQLGWGRFFTTPDVGISYSLLLCQDGGIADRVQDYLREVGIQTRLWYGTGLHEQPHYASAPRDSLPNTEHLAPKLVGLPMASDLTREEITRIFTALQAAVPQGRAEPAGSHPVL